MGTINGAWALGLDYELGSIEVGKKADQVVFNAKRCEWRSIFYPVNNLVYPADGRSVHKVESLPKPFSRRVESKRITY